MGVCSRAWPQTPGPERLKAPQMADRRDTPRILIVEDDEDQRALVAEALALYYGPQGAGRIVAVGTGREALAQDLGSFDIVLQDYHLPDITGLDLVTQILERADLPVIFVTGENDAVIAAEAIGRGAQDYVVKLGDYLFAIPVVVDKNLRQHEVRKENERLQQQRKDMLEELRVKNLQLQESMAKLETMAATDHLTGVANRRRFAELLLRSFDEARRYGFDLSCCMCDLDHYKQLNDALGHQVGDQILQITAEVICQSLRSSDVVARYGGDEFVLLLPHTAMERAVAVGQRIRDQLAIRTGRFGEAGRRLSMSIGIASLKADGPATGDELVAMADRALIGGKERGKDRMILFGEIAPGAGASG